MYMGICIWVYVYIYIVCTRISHCVPIKWLVLDRHFCWFSYYKQRIPRCPRLFVLTNLRWRVAKSESPVKNSWFLHPIIYFGL